MTEPVPPTGITAVRCSDADRERCSVRLRDAAADGRLTMDELEERLSGVYAAKHHHELDALVTDLPRTTRMRTGSGWLAVLAAAWAQLRTELTLLAGRTGTGWPRRRVVIAATVVLVLIASAVSGLDLEFEGGLDDD